MNPFENLMNVKDTLFRIVLMGRLATALPQGSAVEFDKDTIKARITSAYRQTLNEQPWPVIDKHFDAVVGSTPVKLTSTIHL